jgi:hypothetical protein
MKVAGLSLYFQVSSGFNAASVNVTFFPVAFFDSATLADFHVAPANGLAIRTPAFAATVVYLDAIFFGDFQDRSAPVTDDINARYDKFDEMLCHDLCRYK